MRTREFISDACAQATSDRVSKIKRFSLFIKRKELLVVKIESIINFSINHRCLYVIGRSYSVEISKSIITSVRSKVALNKPHKLHGGW